MKHWRNRSISSAHEQALVLCSDFASLCKREGDMSNYYRWRMVMHENRRGAVHTYRIWKKALLESNEKAQLPLM